MSQSIARTVSSNSIVKDFGKFQLFMLENIILSSVTDLVTWLKY